MWYNNNYQYKQSYPYPDMMPIPCYKTPYPNRPMDNIYTYPENLPEALELIRDAVSGEKEDELFYGYLLKNAPSKEDKEIIASIRDDERKHFALFRQIYYELTCQMLPPPPEPEFIPPSSYCAGIEQAIFGELGAVERYRKILYAMQNRVHINKMVDIITDEQKHATKWNYLYSKNQCFDNK